MTELQQTKGKVRVEGIVTGFVPELEYVYKEGQTKTDKEFKSLTLNVKTSPTNTVRNLGLYGQVNETVKLFSNKNGEKKNITLPFEDRHDAPEGFTCFGFGTVRTGFETEGNRIIMKNYFNYDGIDVIKDTLVNDESSVWIDADFKIENYQVNGEDNQSIKYTVNSIGFSKKPIEFEQEGFKEVSSFEQEVMIVSHEIDKQNNRLITFGRIIQYNKTWDDVMFVTDNAKFPKLVENLRKKTKFGDLLTLQGRIVNERVEEEVEEMESLDWGGSSDEIGGLNGRKNSKTVSHLEIVNVKDHKPKTYKESDFIVSEKEIDPFVDKDNSGISDDPFKDDSDPFASDDEDPFQD